MALKSYTNFEEKLTCGFKKDMRNLFGRFSPEHLKVSKLGLDGILLSKVEKYDLKIYRGVMCHDNEE